MTEPPVRIVSDPATRDDPSVAAVMDEADHQRLRGASVDGIVFSVGSQIGLFGLRFAYQVLIARLLLPSDFGLTAMISPVIALIGLFADLGLSQATVQRRDITQGQLSFLFWLNVGAGLLLGGMCIAIAPLVAGFYDEPRLSDLMVVSGGLLFLTGLQSQQMALLNRQMRFRAIATVNFITFITGSVGAVAAALLGAGYWAIITHQIVASLVGLAMAWGLCRWVPGRPAAFASVKPLLQFSGDVTGYRLVHFCSRSVDSVLLGRFSGEHALGLYDRALKLMLMPFNQIVSPFTSVAIPLLSRTVDQPEFYRRAYSRMMEAVLLLIYPGVAFMVANSQELVDLVLGPRWSEVAPIFALLGIDAFVAPIGGSLGWLFISQGRTREMRNWGVLTAAIFVCCFSVGVYWGAVGVAAGYAIAGVLEILFLWRVATRRGPLRSRDFLSLIAPFFLGIGAAFAAMYVLHLLLPTGLASLALKAGCAYVAFAAALALLPGGRSTLRNVAQKVRDLAVRMTPRMAGR